MTTPTEASTRLDRAMLLCAVGLFLTVVEVVGFGFDFTSDTLGFVLVYVGARRLSGEGRRPWGLLTAASAALAAPVSLLAYGGPAGKVLPMTYRLWDAMFYLDVAATAGVVAGLLMVLRARHAGTGPSWMLRSLPLVTASWLVGSALTIVLFGAGAAYSGGLGHLRQAVGVVLGLVECLAAIAALLSARSETERSGQIGSKG